MDNLALAVRLFRKSPGFDPLALLCPALGIARECIHFRPARFGVSPALPLGNTDRAAVFGRGGNPLLFHPGYRALRDRNHAGPGDF